jgi:hypothetical protein
MFPAWTVAIRERLVCGQRFERDVGYGVNAFKELVVYHVLPP